MLFARAVALYPVVLRLQFRIGKIQHHDPPVHADAAVMLPDLLCDFPSARRAVRCEHYQTARLRQNFAGHKTQCFGRCVRQQDAKNGPGRQRYIHGSDQHKPLHLAMCVEVLQQDPVFSSDPVPDQCVIQCPVASGNPAFHEHVAHDPVHERLMDAVSPPVTHMNHRPDAEIPPEQLTFDARNYFHAG